jgi:hypothetical protein
LGKPTQSKKPANPAAPSTGLVRQSGRLTRRRPSGTSESIPLVSVPRMMSTRCLKVCQHLQETESREPRVLWLAYRAWCPSHRRRWVETAEDAHQQAEGQPTPSGDRECCCRRRCGWRPMAGASCPASLGPDRGGRSPAAWPLSSCRWVQRPDTGRRTPGGSEPRPREIASRDERSCDFGGGGFLESAFAPCPMRSRRRAIGRFAHYFANLVCCHLPLDKGRHFESDHGNGNSRLGRLGPTASLAVDVRRSRDPQRHGPLSPDAEQDVC